MIIKKKHAQAAPVSQPPGGETQRSSSEAYLPSDPLVDPYAGDLTEDDFLAGRLPDRRTGERHDRRHNFRRLEDQELISRAQEEATAIRENAAEEGRKQGIAQAEMVIDELRQVMTSLHEARDEALLAASKEISAIALDVAKAIIQIEVSCDEELVLNMVRRTIQKTGPHQKSIMVKVHPSDLERVRALAEAESPLSMDVQPLVMEDELVDPGSCMVETAAGQIDARFSTQLEVLDKLFKTGGKA